METSCGDGFVCGAEICDDGNAADCDGCRGDCSAVETGCGDGFTCGAEECDDGNVLPDDGCSALCLLETPVCGDGNVDVGEFCDDGNTVDCDGCRGDCSAVETGCGDGFVCGVEACDDGNLLEWDGCDTSCDCVEFQVNSHTASSQQSPRVALTGDGSFVAVWRSLGQDGDGYGIYGQRFDAAGFPAGGEFQANTYTVSNQTYPTIASLTNGGFVVVWMSNGQDGSGVAVYGQRFDASGSPVGPEFRVNSYTTNTQSYPSVASADDGRFVVVWHSNGQDGNGYGVFGQLYDSAGATDGNEFVVNSTTTGDQVGPQVAMAGDGRFVVVWQSDGQDGDSAGIFGQRFSATGQPAGAEFSVNAFTTGQQRRRSIAMTDDGRFVVVWVSDGQVPGVWGVFGRRFTSDASSVGGEFQVNSVVSARDDYVRVAMADDGRYVVAFDSPTGDVDGSMAAFVRSYAANGLAQGPEFLLHVVVQNSQASPDVAMMNDGSVLAAWQSDGQDGSADGVFARWHDNAGTALCSGP